LSLRKLLRSTTSADRVLFLLLLLLSLSGILFVKEVLPGGRAVHIEVNGRPAYILPLDEDRTVAVEGPLGKTLIEIENQRVRVTDSPCRNKLCIQQGWVGSGTIICLPNRVVITVGSQDKSTTVDATTG
jgi:hypothetical protein